MAKLTIYGASDDLIEVEGDLSEEFNAYSSEDDVHHYLGFSDGTLLEVTYGRDGTWFINRLAGGTATFAKQDLADLDERAYSERVTLDGDITWVVYGRDFVRASGA
jgi:hypothetical protein